jgi:hypothetical protein
LDDQDEVKAVLLDTGSIVFYPQQTWNEVSFADRPVPPLSRKIRWTVGMVRTAGTAADIGFDFVNAAITTYANGLGFQSSFENRIYECTTQGVTDATEPVFDTVVGNTTADGSAVFTAREAFTRDAVIASVVDRANFTITIDETRAVDGWFADGVVTVESGANLGRSVEVKQWTETGGVVKVFLPFAFDFQIGDQLRISPGCDRTKPTCIGKFVIPGSNKFANGNIKNFRGEPDAPTEETLRIRSEKSLQPRAAASQTNN